MSINDISFFNENVSNINKMVSKILFYMNFVPILFIAFTAVGLFRIPYGFSACVLCYTLILSLAHRQFVVRDIFPTFSMYAGMLGINLFIAVVGANSNVGVYITFGIIPFISCLYYNRRFTTVVTLSSYLMMLVSLYFKYSARAPLFGLQPEETGPETLFSSYIPIALGFTIEFFFVHIVTQMLVKRNYRTLKHIFSLIEDRNGFIDKLQENNSTIEHKNSEYEGLIAELNETQEKIIEFIAENLKSHDLLTGFHVEHTKTYVELICRELRREGHYLTELTDENIKLFSTAAFLHDIGKIHTPEGVLNKPGKFTNEEFEMMKRHPKDGADLIDLLPKIGDGKFNKVAHDIALYHHEKWDGTGYPNGVSGKQIPLCARIMAGADVLDALISLRTYKQPMPIEKAMRIFDESRGTQFEPCVADAVISLQDKIAEIDAEFKRKEREAFYREVEEKHQYNEILKEQIRQEILEESRKDENL